MSKLEDLVGNVYGRLTVLERLPNSVKKRAVRCLCECGNETVAFVANLKRGNTKSCGCFRNQVTGDRARTHGMDATPEYRTWNHIWNRCTNKNDISFPKYGARGIYVVPEWKTFEQFFADMGYRPGPEYSIDRIDNDGPYAPWNCRWATNKEQANNTRVNRVVDAFGEKMSLRNAVDKWSAPLGLHYGTVISRLNLGIPAEDALTRPVKPRCKVDKPTTTLETPT